MTNNETKALLGYLDAQRGHVLAAVEGLSDENLGRPALPSGWTALSMIRHLALDVEHFWFQRCVLGEQVELSENDGAWHVPPEMPAAEVLDLYRAESERSNPIMPRPRPTRCPGGGRTRSRTTRSGRCARSCCT